VVYYLHNNCAYCHIRNHMLVIYEHSGSHCLEAELFLLRKANWSKYISIQRKSKR